MPIDRARSVDALYEEVTDYDLVLTPDLPLAGALNRRLDEPHFGEFATTPRRLAAGQRDRAEDRTAFLAVIDETDHSWKAVSYAVGNVLQCWEHQGTLEAILEYDAYADQATRDVVEMLAALPTTSRRLTEYTIEADSVAVVGGDQFTPLERRILPEEYDAIDLFTGEPFDHPPFHVFDTATAIVDAILDTVDEETADQVAVVLDRGSRYASLVESALDAAGVPHHGGPGFLDQSHHRCFLRLCHTAFRGAETRISDVRPLLTLLGTEIAVDHDDKRLHALDRPETAWVRSFCDRLPERTFGEALSAYEDEAGVALEGFRAELETLGLHDTPVDGRGVDSLAYYLQTYEVPFERETEGVLLADATSSGYVDRPVVFHVGLDEGWTHSPPQRPWVDRDAQFCRYLSQFQLLLQSGVEGYYLVQDTAGGQPVTPCLYFAKLLDVDYERFRDLASVGHTHRFDGSGEGFDREPVAATSRQLRTVSNSSLTTYVNCPRDYFFDRLVDGPDRDYFTEGNLFHDFAEFYVNHPDAVDAETIEDVADTILAEVTPLVAETDRPLRRREYRLGLETIVAYLDEYAPTSEDFLTPTAGWGTNFFAQHFGREVDSPLTEHWFEDRAIGMKGKIDLVRGPDHLVDYKSGSKQSRRDVVKNAAIDPPSDTPNFQAIMYLCYFRTERPDEPLEFTFFHFTETIDDLVAGDHDLEDTLTTVSYYPWTFSEHVGSQAAYDELLDGYKDCVATFEDLGFAAYSDVLSGLQFPETTDRSELRESAFADEFTAAVQQRTSDDVDAAKGCDQAIRRLNGIRKRAFFREDLDAFEGFVRDQLDELNRLRAGEERFPIEGPGGEPNYRRVDHRDCILEGNTPGDPRSGNGDAWPASGRNGDERPASSDDGDERTTSGRNGDGWTAPGGDGGGGTAPRGG